MEQQVLVDEVVVTAEEIAGCVARLAGELADVYARCDNVLVVVLMTGAKWFADDLLAQLADDKFRAEYIKVGSYNGQTESSGTVQIKDSIENKIAGQSVLVVDDIYDTGLTLKKVVRWLTQQGAKDVKTCVMLEKDRQHEEKIDIDFLGTKTPDVFLIGYGLDYRQMYRELPYIAAMKL